MYITALFVNTLKLENTQMFINRRLNKLWHTHTWNTTQQYKKNKLLKARFFKRFAYCIIPFILHFGKGISKMTENRSAVAREGQRQESECKKSLGELFRVVEMLSILIVVVVTGLYASVKTHRTVAQGEFYFKLYHNKLDFKNFLN